MPLIRFDAVSLKFGAHALLRETDFMIDAGERVCLIGRNGAGKTSMLRLVTGEVEPDSGEINMPSVIGISQLEQALPRDLNQQVTEFVAGGLDTIQSLCREYRERSQQALDAAGLRELQLLQDQIETHGGWNVEQQVKTVCSELDLPTDRSLSELSGGWCRRVCLARALVSRPDLLLLDEPTNHLDLDTIEWLERRLNNFMGALLFITHDRSFLQNVATRIVEIDRGKLRSWPGDYRRYLFDKEQSLSEEQRSNSEFDKKLAEEEAWIRQGIKARRRRNEGRVRSLVGMRRERAERVVPEGKVRIHIEESERSGKKIIEARRVCYGYGDTRLVDDFSMRILRGDRIGVVGNNGVGKSTLLRILTGELQPQSGSIKWGVNIEVGYFDQHRRSLDPKKTVAEVVGEGKDYIELGGNRRHVIGYLRGFLFTAKRAMTPVGALSGGERNRVILAHLFTQPSNLLVLDEPTNDLDVETLEVLEDRLLDYSGTLIVVSHDREFLDNVVTSIVVFEQDGRVREYVGGYRDWLKHGRSLAAVDGQGVKLNEESSVTMSRADRQTAKPRLTYKLQRELDQLPETISRLEGEVEALRKQVAAPGFYDHPYDMTRPVLDRLQATEAELEAVVERWAELEESGNALKGAR